jgi:hypothetical protein
LPRRLEVKGELLIYILIPYILTGLMSSWGECLLFSFAAVFGRVLAGH